MVAFKFSELYTMHNFTAIMLDMEAEVSIGTTDLMLQEQPVTREAALKVLKALSLQTKRYYTLSNVEVKLLGENEESIGAVL